MPNSNTKAKFFNFFKSKKRKEKGWRFDLQLNQSWRSQKSPSDRQTLLLFSSHWNPKWNQPFKKTSSSELEGFSAPRLSSPALMNTLWRSLQITCVCVCECVVVVGGSREAWWTFSMRASPEAWADMLAVFGVHICHCRGTWRISFVDAPPSHPWCGEGGTFPHNP